MKRISIIMTLIFAFMANVHGQEIRRIGNTWNQPKKEESKQVNKSVTSSSIKKDTIVIQELIKRTDVVHRTEEVIKRVETAPYDNEDLFRTNHPIIDSIDFDWADDDLEEADENYPEKDLILSAPSGGNYIWVPDSMENQVMSLLRGQAQITDKRNSDEEVVDKDEMVTFRGRKIPMILKDRNLGRYDRGLFNYLFIPKGIWQIGLTASYGEFSTSDLEILDLISDIDFNGKIFSVKPYFQYFFKSNLSLGLKLGYTQGTANIGSFKVDIDDDMSFNLHDIMYKSRNYSAALTFSQYLGIARKGRFGVFNEVEMALSGGESDFHRPFNGDMRRTHTEVFQAALNFSPGICVFVMEQVSFQVSFGVFGLNVKHEKQTVNEEPMGKRTTSGANFRFNIFNINFGIAVNI